ncbi:MAG TPA: GNAT family N-acetyltransferase [Polyangiaceae bacterium]|nr:GNAT family N-acetyltransferase [Polyangiaceae bacterium]
MAGTEDRRGSEIATFSIRKALPGELHVLNALDDDAVTLYAEYGIRIELGPDHVFARDELRRWLRSAELGRTFLAVDGAEKAVGFAALDVVDGEPYLDQLAVAVASMRRGIGGRLLASSAEWARSTGGSALWLTTYDHLPFNRPYYERHGYVVVPESACGPGIVHHLDEQRRHLPAPAQRVAMRLAL